MRSYKGILIAAAMVVGTTSAFAQVSAYYVTDGTAGVGNTHVLQGGTEQFAYQWVSGGQMPIAVGDFGSGMRVRQAVGQPLSGNPEQGNEYTLAGVATGGTNLWSRTQNANTGYDAGFDGTHIYMIDWTGGQVYQYDNNYNGGTYMFNANTSDLGITFDSGTNTIWTSNWGSGTVSQWSMGGALLSSFHAAGSNLGALAYDSADQSLWMSNGSEMIQYDRAGNLLSRFSYGTYVLGGEFAAVPEPATMALLGLGALAALRRKRKA